MDTLIGFLVFAAIIVGLVLVARRAKAAAEVRRAEEAERKLAPVKRLADEDVTALGEELQDLDLAMAGRELDEGERADYQRALDAYESAKEAVTAIKQPDDVKHVTEILEDGRYAMACVQARVAGDDLPSRRPPCFFDPRHGMATEDVTYAPPGGAEREVPACALDAQRVRAGAEPDVRQVMVGARRMPYWQGGPAYAPYATGYFGSGLMPAMFMGMMIGGGMDGLGEGLGDIGEGIGDGFEGIGDGIGDMFGGFDF
ncbi:MAG: hypothetical protein ACRDO7_15320 [Nocardioidaceae bacterium]